MVLMTDPISTDRKFSIEIMSVDNLIIKSLAITDPEIKCLNPVIALHMAKMANE
jgi:hypothetical protein